MNEQLRMILDVKIKKMLSDAKLASKINHPGMAGKLRELFLNDLFRPLLNDKYSSGTGKVTDYRGTLSNEMDICVYSTSLLPPFFFSHNDKTGIYPIESVLGCVEVKSLLNQKEIRDAYKKFFFMERELKFTPGIHDEYNRPKAHYFSKPEYSIFAYDIDKRDYKITSILDMYKKVDSQWENNPLITSVCVANKGCLIHTTKGWLHMAHNLENQINEEIIFYICATVQGFPTKEISRNIPRIGYYLTNPTRTVRFEKGIPLKRSWSDEVWVISNLNVKDR
jgi:hypothetical protein